MNKIVIIFKITFFIIVFMCQTPCNEIVSNFSTYIPNSILELLPNFIQNKKFDDYATLIAIILIIISFLPLKKWFNKKAKSSKPQDVIKLIINNLLQNLSNYEKFYNYYTMDHRPNKQYEANLLSYIDEALLVIDSNNYLQSVLDIKMLLDTHISTLLIAFYKKSQKHFSKLEYLEKYIKTHDLESYKNFGVPHSKTHIDIQNGVNTVDIYKDFNDYMDSDYVPKIKKLIEEARELINILRSKHIA